MRRTASGSDGVGFHEQSFFMGTPMFTQSMDLEKKPEEIALMLAEVDDAPGERWGGAARFKGTDI